jgi:hypothetical protein
MRQIGANEENGLPLTQGDIAILRFLAAAEIIESDRSPRYFGTQLSCVRGGLCQREVKGRSCS